MKFIVIFFLIGSVFHTIVYGKPYQGVVFEDVNRNNRFDQQEIPLANILVSDGYTVVKTDKAGRFILVPHADARFLFVTIPAGYKASRTHYIALSDPQNDYDFGLIKDEKQGSETLRIIQITDTETAVYGSWIDNVRSYAKEQGAALVMHTGDICYEHGMRFHAQQVNTSLMGVPVYYTVGNHDLVKGVYGEKLFEELFGPTYYSFDAGPAHFVVTPMAHGDYKPSYTIDQVINWLKQDLALKDQDKPLIFINHDFPVGDDFILKGEKEQIDLKAFNLKAWLYGHWHNNYLVKRNGVYILCSGAPNKGGIDNSVGQFVVLDIDAQGIQDIKPVYPNIRNHVQVLSPQRNDMILLDRGKLKVHVNVYDSEHQIDKVEIQVHDDAGIRLLKARLDPIGDWHWQAIVPFAQAAEKTYDMLVTVTYRGGKSYLHTQSFTIGDSREHGLLQLEWTKNVGGNIWKSSPLIIQDRVFIATMDDGLGHSRYLKALDKYSGKEIWSARPVNSIKQKLHYDKGLILATDVESNVYAWEVKSGKLRWKKSLGEQVLPTFVSGPMLDQHTYYSGLGKKMAAMDTESGKIHWQGTDPIGGEATPASYTLSDEVLYVGVNWNSLRAYNKKDGGFLWKRDDEGLRFRSGGVTVMDDYLYTTGLNGLFMLDPKTGKNVNSRMTEDDFKVMGNPLVLEELLIMPTSTNGLKAFDRHTLQEKWTFTTGEALVYTAPYTTPDQRKGVYTIESSVTEVGEKLLFGASDGYFYVLDKTGRLLDKINIGAPIFAEPTIEGDRVYVADFAGNVSCFRLY